MREVAVELRDERCVETPPLEQHTIGARDSCR